MGERFHELDPDGDVVLILQNPDVAFAVRDEGRKYLPPPPIPPLPDGVGAEQEPRNRKKKGKKVKRRVTPPEPVEPVEAIESIEPVELNYPNYQDQRLALGESSPPCSQSSATHIIYKMEHVSNL